MRRSLLKTVSAVALSTTFGLFASAYAADLGGDCCADLEERVAELEATTVRKGNRKVSLTISGFVGHQVMWWNDGVRSDTYFGDGGNIFSRFRFTGSAKISPAITAGFTYEFAANPNAIGTMNQANFGDDLGPSGNVGGNTSCGVSGIASSTVGCATLRDATVWIRHANLGMVKIGQGSTATDNLVLIDLGKMSSASTPDIPLYSGGMFWMNKGGGAIASDGVGIVPITMGQLVNGGRESWDTNRRDHVLYETPSLFGFTVQGAIAEDNFWDVALRYAGEIGGFRLAFGIGYREDTKFNSGFQAFSQDGVLCTSRCEEKEKGVLGSASLLHVPTGLFVTGAGGSRKVDRVELLGSSDNRHVTADFWYVAGGISKNFFGIGNTVAFGEYSQHNDALRFLFSDVTGSQIDHWGAGLVQHIDAAAMELFITYKHYSADFTRNNGTLAAPVIGHVIYRDIDTVIAGTKINF